MIEVGMRQVRVVGTAFNIRHIDDHTDIAVTEGAVNLTREAGMWAPLFPPETSQRLTAGMLASYVSNADVVLAKDIAVSSVAPWRHGRLVYRRARLADVIADLDRYFPGSLVVRGQEAADLKVSAVIHLGTKEAVLEALASQLPIKVQALDEEVTEISGMARAR